MSTMTTTPPRTRAAADHEPVAETDLPRRHTWTAADLAHTPDDGNRYELIDGTLIVTPAPRPQHQRRSTGLFKLLLQHCPDHLEVFAASPDVYLAEDTVVQPDLIMVDPDRFDEKGYNGAPLLVVEILSPSTRLYDLNLKKARYEEAGCPSWWVIDPGSADRAPSITAWELGQPGRDESDDAAAELDAHDGAPQTTNARYEQVGHAEGGESLRLTQPFEVTITPAALNARGLRKR